MSGNSSKKISMSNRKIFEILRLSPRESDDSTSNDVANMLLKECKENGLMDRWTKLLHYYKGPSQASSSEVKSRGNDGVKLVNTPEYRLLSDVSELLNLDQVQCTHLWRHFRDQRAKHSSAKQLLTCTVLERIMSFHFAERTFLIRSVQELLLKCHERSHPLNEISRKIVKELLSKRILFNTLIELLSQGFRSSPPWCRDDVNSSGKEMQFKLPDDVRKTGMVHLLSTVIRDPKGLQSFWGNSYHIDFVKSEASLGSTVYVQSSNGLKRGKILSIDKDDRSSYVFQDSFVRKYSNITLKNTQVQCKMGRFARFRKVKCESKWTLCIASRVCGSEQQQWTEQIGFDTSSCSQTECLETSMCQCRGYDARKCTGLFHS